MSKYNTSPHTSPQSTADSRVTSPSRYSKAAHLTEFYPYLNGGIQKGQAQDQELKEAPSVKSSHYHHREPETFSMTESYTSFTPSTLDFRNLVTKTDIKQTIEAYDDIISAADEYKKALSKVAEAAGNFGAALENGAKCKGTGSAAEGMLSASGLFFIVANHEQILSHSVKESFEDPIISEVNQFKLQTLKNDGKFKVDIQERVRDLKRQERENAKLSKGKTRNLLTYRSKLMELTSQIDEIDKLKHDYYQSSFDLVQETSNNILTKLGSVVRAQVEIYENIARKGWSGGGLDDLIARCPDPFANDEVEDKDNTIKNGDLLEDLRDDNDNDTIEAEASRPELQTTANGLIFNRKNDLVPLPVLSHQQSVQTFNTVSLVSSTPIRNVSKNLSEDNDKIIKLGAKTHEVQSHQDPDESIDDNSFSLPVLGSSRGGSTSFVKKAEDCEDDKIDEEKESKVEQGRLEKQEENDTANVLTEFNGHNHWHSDSIPREASEDAQKA